MKPAKRKRRQGSGSLFLNGRFWWMQFYVRGRRVKESSECTDRSAAEEVLKRRLAEVAIGEMDGIVPDRVTIAEICQLVLTDYRLRKLRDVKIVEWRYNAHVKPALGAIMARRANGKHFRNYIEDRRAAGTSDGTINRELAIVRRAYTLAMREEPPLVRKAPYIPKLEEDNVRQGFLEPEQYESLLTELPERLKALFVCAYHVGTRKGELRKIQWSQVDFDAGLIHLAARQTKGKTARSLPIYGEMERWLRSQLENRKADCPWVFYHHQKPVGAQLRGWREACVRAGLPGLLFHDLRRSAVRNMKRAGVQDTVAMRISGHKTRSVFDRYNITDQDDMQNAGQKLQNYFAARKSERAAKLRRVK